MASTVCFLAWLGSPNSQSLHQAFRLFDDDETGKISFKNLKRVAKELGERMTDEELQEMIDESQGSPHLLASSACLLLSLLLSNTCIQYDQSSSGAEVCGTGEEYQKRICRGPKYYSRRTRRQLTWKLGRHITCCNQLIITFNARFLL